MFSRPRSVVSPFAVLAVAFVVPVLSGSVLGCGGSTPPSRQATTAPGGSKDPSQWPKDDKTLCDWRTKPELEVTETAGSGSLKPNVRRVFKVIGERDSRRKTIVCREVDTNLDGLKDVARTFNDKGEAVHEEADTNYDGKLDVWISFVGGRLAEVQVDRDFDGRPDEWKYYVDGALSRVKRDRNKDGKPDVWEVYVKGRLERMGVDETADGHVDRWDRDLQAIAQAEADEQKAKSQLDGGAGASDGGTAASDAGSGDASKK
ncbi:MAG: hypothetical protein U0169_14260 [Polyangiaceae bacterium]